MHQRLMERFRSEFPEFVNSQGESHWEIECGTGWGFLIYGFFSDVKALCDENCATFEIGQIKEKFGSLRLYCSLRGGTSKGSTEDYVPEHFGQIFSFRPYPKNPTLATLVQFYENISSNYCELCGNAGHIDGAVTQKTHWATALCYPHAKLLIERKDSDYDDEFESIAEVACKNIEERIEKLRSKNK